MFLYNFLILNLIKKVLLNSLDDIYTYKERLLHTLEIY